MKKSELRKLVLEVMAGGYEQDEQGNLVPHSDKFDSTKLSSILTKIAKRRPEDEEPISEEITDVKNVVITYTSPGRFYSVKVDGVKLPGFDAAKEFIKNHTGLELPSTNSEVVDEIIDALKAKGIDARESEMDVS
jgi:hypothetical protein